MKVTNEMVRGGMEALNAVTGKAMPAADRARCVLEAALHDVPEPVPGPFVLSQSERNALVDARAYPADVLVEAIERACATLGPQAGRQWNDAQTTGIAELLDTLDIVDEHLECGAWEDMLAQYVERKAPSPRAGPFVLNEVCTKLVANVRKNPAIHSQWHIELVDELERAVRTLGPQVGGEWTDEDYAAAGEALALARDRSYSSGIREALDAVKHRLHAPLVLAPAEPQPDAPTNIPDLPMYWDERRAKQGKPDKSRCAAELRIALASSEATEPVLSFREARAADKTEPHVNFNEEDLEVAQFVRHVGQIIGARRIALYREGELGTAALASDKPDEPYKQGFSDGFARGVEYGRALAQLGKP